MNEYINKIICGDCLEVLKGFPDKSVDLVCCDPPYGIDYQSARRSDKSEWKPKIANDTEPFIDWLPDAYRILDNGGRLICFCRWDVEQIFIDAIKSAGFEVKSEIIWDKMIHGMGDLCGEFAPQHETILYATKGRYEFCCPRPKSIIRHQRVTPEILLHPNEKPVGLMVTIIQALTTVNELVLDCFSGSGSTCVAAKVLGRRYIGIEIDQNYARIAEERLRAVDTAVPVKEQRKGQLSLLEGI